MTPTIQVPRPADLHRGAAGEIHAELARLPGVAVEAVSVAPARRPEDAVVRARTTATPAQLGAAIAAVKARRLERRGAADLHRTEVAERVAKIRARPGKAPAADLEALVLLLAEAWLEDRGDAPDPDDGWAGEGGVG